MYCLNSNMDEQKVARLGSFSLLSSMEGVHRFFLRPLSACRQLHARHLRMLLELKAKRSAESLLRRIRFLDASDQRGIQG